jgi:hypothetical protein
MDYKDSSGRGGTVLVLLALLIIIALSLMAGGCVTLAQDSVSAEFSHTSHPVQGFPFGPEHEEATLDVVQIVAHKKLTDKLYLEQGLGVRISHPCDFYGDKYLYNVRLGYTLWNRE